MPEKRVCPSCGQPVYATDDVCMSCGADLRSEPAPPEGPPQPQAAAPAPRPSHPIPRQRPPIVKPWYHALVESCGRLWDIYPWIGIVLYVVGGVFFAPGMPELFGYVILAISLLWQCLFLFWLIVDALYFGADWWWVLVAFLFCYPIGLLLYLWKGR